MKYANNYCKVIIYENRIDVIEKCLKLCEFLFEQELGRTWPFPCAVNYDKETRLVGLLICFMLN